MDGIALNSRQKRRVPVATFEIRLLVSRLRALLDAVALTELVDLLGGLQDVLLAGVERVRLARDFELQQRAFLAVFPLDGVASRYRRPGQDGEIGGNVLENDVSVFGMNVLFHGTAMVGKSIKGANFHLLAAKVQVFFGIAGIIQRQFTGQS